MGCTTARKKSRSTSKTSSSTAFGSTYVPDIPAGAALYRSGANACDIFPASHTDASHTLRVMSKRLGAMPGLGLTSPREVASAWASLCLFVFRWGVNVQGSIDLPILAPNVSILIVCKAFILVFYALVLP